MFKTVSSAPHPKRRITTAQCPHAVCHKPSAKDAADIEIGTGTQKSLDDSSLASIGCPWCVTMIVEDMLVALLLARLNALQSTCFSSCPLPIAGGDIESGRAEPSSPVLRRLKSAPAANRFSMTARWPLIAASISDEVPLCYCRHCRRHPCPSRCARRADTIPQYAGGEMERNNRSHQCCR